MSAILILAFGLTAGQAEAPGHPFTLAERLRPDAAFDLSSTVNVTGKHVKTSARKPGRKKRWLADAVQALGAIQYNERVLRMGDGGQVAATLRYYRQATVSKQTDRGKRRQVRLSRQRARVAVLRSGGQSTIFCPDGPLSAEELELLEAGVFTPALLGLLPDRPVAIGQRWKAAPQATSELTGVEPIQSGYLQCTLQAITDSDRGTKAAKIVFAGSLAGPTELGQARQKVEGYVLFDVDRRYLAQVVLTARSQILDQHGHVAIELTGRHEIRRQPSIVVPELTDASLRGLSLKPSRQNTGLLFDSSQLGIRLVYPRNWELVALRRGGAQFTEASGGNLRLTVDQSAPERLESLYERLIGWLKGQKARITEQGRALAVSVAGGGSGQRMVIKARFPASGRRSQTSGREFHCILLRQGSRRAAIEASLLANRADVLRDDVLFLAGQLRFSSKKP